MRGWSDEQLKLLRKLHCQGKSAREIQEQIPDKTIHQGPVVDHQEACGLWAGLSTQDEGYSDVRAT